MKLPNGFDIPVEELNIAIPTKFSIQFKDISRKINLEIRNATKTSQGWFVQVAYRDENNNDHEVKVPINRNRHDKMFITIVYRKDGKATSVFLT